MPKITINPETDFLLNIDPQIDFMPGGALAVAGGDEIVPLVNEIVRLFRHKGASKDMHPADHGSFASQHSVDPFTLVKLGEIDQVAWPDHCVQGTPGVEFHPDLDTTGYEIVVGKGFRKEVDSYSAFFENDKTTRTGLAAYLHERGFKRVFLVGLAYDFCVGYSALDAVQEGFEAYVIEDATRAIGMPTDNGTTITEINAAFAKAGVQRINSADLLAA